MSSIDVNYLREGNPGVFDEVVTRNGYDIQKDCFKGQMVLDLGAHIGTFAYMARVVGNADIIVCVEPNPKNVERLEHSFGNHISFVIDHRAISHDYTPVRISDQDNVSVVGDAGHQVYAVPLREFTSRYSQYSGNATLKIDVEGQEYNALWSASRSDVTFFKTILLETHDSVERHLAMNAYLNLFGYRITRQYHMFKWDVLPDGQTTNWQPLDAWVSRFDL
jgi:FkbM family methyltransferase